MQQVKGALDIRQTTHYGQRRKPLDHLLLKETRGMMLQHLALQSVKNTDRHLSWGTDKTPSAFE